MAEASTRFPFGNVPQLVLDLVYQEDHHLQLRRDADLLGLRLVSEKEELEQLARQAGPQTVAAIQDLLLAEQDKNNTKKTTCTQ